VAAGRDGEPSDTAATLLAAAKAARIVTVAEDAALSITNASFTSLWRLATDRSAT
jgi:hypothetical protein